MILKIKYCFHFLLLLTMFSCKQQNSITNSIHKNIKHSVLNSIINNKNQSWEQIVIKGAKITIDDNSSIINLKANLIISKDSVILISLSNFMGIEISRALLTNDSIKIIDRINKTYILGKYEDISKKYNLTINFIQIQSILISNSSKLVSNEFNNLNIDDTIYSKNNEYELNIKNRNNNNIEIKLKISSDNFNINQIVFKNFDENQIVLIDYIGSINLKSNQFPEIIEIDFEKGKKNLLLAIQYKNIKLEKHSKLKLSIPKNYQQNTFVGYDE